MRGWCNKEGPCCALAVLMRVCCEVRSVWYLRPIVVEALGSMAHGAVEFRTGVLNHVA
jgi:hypothetical protein